MGNNLMDTDIPGASLGDRHPEVLKVSSGCVAEGLLVV